MSIICSKIYALQDILYFVYCPAWDAGVLVALFAHPTCLFSIFLPQSTTFPSIHLQILEFFRTFVHMTKQETYQTLIPQIESLVAGESDAIANMANVAAALHEAFGFWWTGFYRVEGQQLVLGPFHGPIACSRIPSGRGVCGTAWQRAETVIVPNVHEFAGHIACSSASNSEIVVPILHDGRVVAVLDIDSTDFGTFDEIDKKYLEKIAASL